MGHKNFFPRTSLFLVPFSASFLLRLPGLGRVHVQGSSTAWFADPNILTSLGALIISLIALLVSQRNTDQQARREKREELRNVCDRLINLRQDLNSKYNQILDVNVRTEYGSLMNNERSIYLETAEALTKELADEVTASEYNVLGTENFNDSDFTEARNYYKKAVKASKKASVIVQATALRLLADCLYVEEIRDLVEARKCYETALRVLGERTDNYSIYSQVFTLRDWANQEMMIGNLAKADDILKVAFTRNDKLPDWFSPKMDEKRFIVALWRNMGQRYFNGDYPEAEDIQQRVEKARAVYQKCMEILQPLFDNASVFERGQLFSNWSVNENLFGSKAEGAVLRDKARDVFLSLPANYPWREDWLKTLENTTQPLPPAAVQENEVVTVLSGTEMLARPVIQAAEEDGDQPVLPDTR